MTVLVDTSALFGLLDDTDAVHERAAASWLQLYDTRLVTHRHVEVEVAALVERRLGMHAVRVLYKEMLPAIDVLPVTTQLHAAAVARWLEADRRQLSLVDVTSFEVMEQQAIATAFAFDDDFRAAGFDLLE